MRLPGRTLVAQHEARDRDRRGLWLALILLVGAIAITAVSQPTPRSDARVLAFAGQSFEAAMNSHVSGASTSSSTPPPPFLDRRSVPSHPLRPDVRVPQPLPRVVVRAGAAGGKAVFLGDSYTSGWNGAGLGPRGWVSHVGRARNWQTVNLAVAGSGFINPGWTGQPVGSRVTAATREHPNVVFIAAGHNDSRWSTAATASAADRVIDRLRLALPDALLVIVAPIWPNASPPTRCLVLRDHLRRKAASVGAVFIDPLAERWFAGSSHSFIGADGIHPTDAGHRFIAQHVLADLARVR